MTYKNISQLKDSISGILQGLNLNSVKNLNLAIERTARQTCILLDIPEATLTQQVTLYDGVTDYAPLTNLFATAINDLRPQGTSRSPSAFAYKEPPSQFDRQKSLGSTGFALTYEYDKGTGILRVNSSLPTARIELDPMTDTTGWTAAGSASALTKDSTVFWQAPSALRMLLTGASTGTLTKTIPSTDLTDYRSVGVAFLAFRTPSATNLTSIELRIGSDASNYYTVTVTSGFIKAFAANEWMLASFDLSTATTVGTPVITAIDYAQVRITHGATLTNFYVGDLWISLPTPMTAYYQTNAIFLPQNSSTPSTTITNDNDTVQLNDSALAIFEIQCAIEIAQQQGGSLASNSMATLEQKLNGVRGYRGVLVQPGLLDLYRADNPSRELREIGNYYDD